MSTPTITCSAVYKQDLAIVLISYVPLRKQGNYDIFLVQIIVTGHERVTRPRQHKGQHYNSQQTLHGYLVHARVGVVPLKQRRSLRLLYTVSAHADPPPLILKLIYG